MTRYRIAIMAVLAVAAGLSLPRAARAQDVPVVFVHGIFSNGDVWRDTSARLANVLQIQPYVVDLSSTESLNTQAAQLNAAMGSLPANAIAVGHSQGGLIARQWHRSRPLAGILTLGTPHAGAPLSQRSLDIINFHGVAYNLAGLVGSFGNGNQFGWIVALLQQALWDTQWLTANVVASTASTVAVVNRVPVAPQLVPGSAFLNDLNSGGNLDRERISGVKRASLVYTADQYWRGGVAVGLAPDARNWVWAVQVGAPPLFEYAAAYVDATYGPYNYTARTFVNLLRNLSGYVREMDPMWCWAVTGDRTCQTPHDGIVPVTNQTYPGGLSFNVYGPAHLQERQRSDNELAGVLRTVMGIRARGASTPPPPPPPPSTGADVLGAGEFLGPDQQVRSADGAYRLLYQWDGNLVLYGPDGAVWSSGTEGYSAGSVQMQGDGNLVIYDGAGEPLWATDTFEPGSYLEVHNDGYLMVHSPAGTGLWWTGSGSY